MNKTPSTHRLTALSNGDVLVSGGTTDGTLGAQKFGNTSSTWSSAGTMPQYAIYHTATLLTDGRVLVVSDLGPNGMLYQPSNNTWSATSNDPQGRYGGAA